MLIAHRAQSTLYGSVVAYLPDQNVFQTSSVFDSYTVNATDIVALDNSRFAVVFDTQNASSVRIIVGSWNSTALTFGTWGAQLQIDVTGAVPAGLRVIKIDTDKLLIYYRKTTNYLYGRVITVSGTTCTLGTEYLLHYNFLLIRSSFLETLQGHWD